LSAPDQVAGVVLAAGLSTRMGRNKLLLEVGGEPVVARAVRSARDAGLDPVLVVMGHEADRLRAAIADLPVTTVTNPEPARGIHTSLRVGFQALAERPDEPKAAVVMLGDMPLVSSAMVRRLVDGWRGSRPHPSLVISLYGEVVAPPILYGAPLFAELSSLDGDGCGKRVVKRHRAEALEVHWPPWALADLDEPDDLVRVERLLGRALELS
jgi:molybdenum cofactor cytidylyltransferase